MHRMDKYNEPIENANGLSYKDKMVNRTRRSRATRGRFGRLCATYKMIRTGVDNL